MSENSYDCVIVGAGFGGIRALIEARRRGWSARVIEAGSDVGGTWYWNRFPGARTDSQSWVYCFNFDTDLLQDWDWPNVMSDQPALENYFRHVADRFDLRRDIDFNSVVQEARRDESRNRWVLRTENGSTYSCKYLITATGQLAHTIEDPFPGLEKFGGECYYTSKWPKTDVDFSGKRVAVIGTGATGIQIIPQIAASAAELTVLQRTPNYVLPTRNRPLDAPVRSAIKRDYENVWKQANEQAFGFAMGSAERVMADVDADERERILEKGWEIGGFEFIFEMFDDLLTNDETNEIVAEFVRGKMRSMVDDPATAELLCPHYPLGAKRPPLGTHYLETYNRSNVSLVDVSSNAIREATETGIELADGSRYEFDMIVLATGFDAAIGGLLAMNIHDAGERPLSEVWKDGASAYLGMFVPGFPNLFMLGGPGFPFGNSPTITSWVNHWIGDAISHMEANGYDRVEATPEATQEWVQTLQTILDATVMRTAGDVRAWTVGANVEGRVHTPLFYLGGVPGYFGELEKSAANGYAGLDFTSTAGLGSESTLETV